MATSLVTWAAVRARMVVPPTTKVVATVASVYREWYTRHNATGASRATFI